MFYYFSPAERMTQQGYHIYYAWTNMDSWWSCSVVMVMTATKNDDVDDDDDGGDNDGDDHGNWKDTQGYQMTIWLAETCSPPAGVNAMRKKDIGMRWTCDTLNHKCRSLYHDNSTSQSCEHRCNIVPYHTLILKARLVDGKITKHGQVILISTDQSWASLHPKWGSISSPALTSLLLSPLWTISSTSLAGFSCLDPTILIPGSTSWATSLFGLWLWRASSWVAVFSVWDCKACTAKETARNGFKHIINVNKHVFVFSIQHCLTRDATAKYHRVLFSWIRSS